MKVKADRDEASPYAAMLAAQVNKSFVNLDSLVVLDCYDSFFNLLITWSADKSYHRHDL